MPSATQMTAPLSRAAATAAAIVLCGRCAVPSPPPPAAASTNNVHAIISVVRATVTARGALPACGELPAGWASASPPVRTITRRVSAAIAKCLMMGNLSVDEGNTQFVVEFVPATTTHRVHGEFVNYAAIGIWNRPRQ